MPSTITAEIPFSRAHKHPPVPAAQLRGQQQSTIVGVGPLCVLLRVSLSKRDTAAKNKYISPQIIR